MPGEVEKREDLSSKKKDLYLDDLTVERILVCYLRELLGAFSHLYLELRGIHFQIGVHEAQPFFGQ